MSPQKGRQRHELDQGKQRKRSKQPDDRPQILPMHRSRQSDYGPGDQHTQRPEHEVPHGIDALVAARHKTKENQCNGKAKAKLPVWLG
ncbi:MAG: hypothetical protein P8Y48_17615 [Novosphingobium sp.]